MASPRPQALHRLNPLQRLREAWEQWTEARALRRGLPVRDGLDPQRNGARAGVRAGFDQALVVVVLGLV